MHPPCFPPTSPRPALPSLRRVPAVLVPLLHRYYGVLRHPAALSPDFGCLRPAIPCGATCAFAPVGPGRPTAGQGFVAGPHYRHDPHGGVQDFPGSWGTLLFLCRVLRPRQDRRVRRLDVVGTAPAMSTTKAPTISCLSGLNGTALELAVYASCGRLSGQHATLASGCWPALPGGIGYPLGSMKGFSVVSLHRFPLSQALPGARTLPLPRTCYIPGWWEPTSC